MNSRQNEPQQNDLQNSRHLNFAPPLTEAPAPIRSSQQLVMAESLQPPPVLNNLVPQNHPPTGLATSVHPQIEQTTSQYYQSPMVNPPTGPIMLEPTQNIHTGHSIQQTGGIIQPTQTRAPLRGGGVEKMNGLSGIFIAQKVEAHQKNSDCASLENIYHVYGLDEDMKKKGFLLFRCKERSSTCSRSCLSGACRPFQMTISYAGLAIGDSQSQPFISLERSCKCGCLCFNRPEIKVTLVEGGRNEYIGKIVDHWNLCTMDFDVFDSGNTKKYIIDGGCCQVGFFCKCTSTRPCQNIDFNVKAPSGEVISRIQKRTPGEGKKYVLDPDNFAVEFPLNSTSTDKALLMSAVLFMDYRLFDGKIETPK